MTPQMVHRYTWPVREAIEHLLGEDAGDCETWRIRIEADEVVIDVAAPIESQTPAGEKIRSARGDAMEAVPATGQPPVGTASPSNEPAKSDIAATEADASLNKSPKPDIAPAKPPHKGGALARQAGIICGEKGFWTFLGKKFGVTVVSADEAATWLKAQCGVTSRIDFDHDSGKAANFREIDGAYRLWLDGFD